MCDTNKSKEKKTNTDALAAGNSSALLWSLKRRKHQKSGEKKSPLESHKEPFNYYITFMHEKKPGRQSTLSVKLKDMLEHYRLHSKTWSTMAVHSYL